MNDKGQIVVLVNPNYRENPLNTLRPYIFFPPLGLDSIYTYLREKRPEVKLFTVDGFLNNMSDAETTEEILKHEPDIVGFTSTYINLKDVLSICGNIKKQNGPIVTVIGGPGAKSLKALKEGANVKSLDYCVIGDGEKALEGIIDQGRANEKTTYIKEIVTDFDFPYPKREAFDTERYIQVNQKLNPISSQRMLQIITSKGCDWAQCTFCTVDKKYRARSLDSVKKELDYLVRKFSISIANFLEDNFYSYRNSHRAFVICDILDSYPNLRWSTETRVSDIVKDTNLGKKLFKAIYRSRGEVFFGAESGDEKILKILRKGITPEDIEKAVSIATDANVPSKLFFIYNSPGESEKSLTHTKNFIDHLIRNYYIKLILISEYVNIPGSVGWHLGLKEGNVKRDIIKKFIDSLGDICASRKIKLSTHSYK